MKSHGRGDEAAAAEAICKSVFPADQERRLFTRLAKAWPDAVSIDALREICGNPSPLLSRMRTKLQKFYQSAAGDTLDYIIEIGKGSPSLHFKANPAAEGRRRRLFRRAFWAPYQRASPQTLILYTEVLFFRQPEHRAFIRFQDFNSYPGSPSFAEFQSNRPYLAEHRGQHYIRLFELGQPKGQPEVKDEDPMATYRATRKSMRIRRYELIPIRYFVTTGEMYCIQAVSGELFGLSVTCEVRAEHTVQGLHIPDADLILLGNVRTHRLVAELNGPDAILEFEQFPFRIEERGVARFAADTGGPRRVASYDDYTIADAAGLQYFVYALVTRLQGPLTNRFTTIIAAHHSAAFKAIAAYLQNDERMAQLAARLRVQAGAEFPPQFQVLFEVRITRHDEETVGEVPVAALVDHYVPQIGRPPRR